MAINSFNCAASSPRNAGLFEKCSDPDDDDVAANQ